MALTYFQYYFKRIIQKLFPLKDFSIPFGGRSRILISNPPGSALKIATGRKYDDLEVILKCLSDDSIYFDVGANYGYYTLKVHDTFQNCKIHCFEPENEAYRRLLINRRINNANWKCSNLGLGESESWSFITTQLGGYNHITKNSDGQLIRVIKLDDYIEQVNIKHVDVLKIDVEGFEYFVLKGAKKSLEEKVFKNIIFESDSHEHRYEVNISSIESLLNDCGYTCKQNDEGNFQHWTC